MNDVRLTREIGAPHEIGSLRIPYLEDFLSRTLHPSGTNESREWVADNTLLSGLRLGLRETLDYIFNQRPTLVQLETWILEKNGGALDPDRVERLNAALAGQLNEEEVGDPVLTSDDLAFWNENGYVVLHDAVSPEQCEAAAQAIYGFLGMDPGRPDTWYGGPQGHSIWIPLLHHPAFWANRDSPRIHRAFAQLWGRADLWATVDQCGMNPPERPGWVFPGPHLHFDVSLALPVPFGVQGILYLTDTEANQGAFTCVPGFHKIIETWLKNLPPGADPRQEDLSKLGAIPIPGRAGDLVIWHQALPHGSSPNRSGRPRVVQYITMRPSQWEYNPVWR